MVKQKKNGVLIVKVDVAIVGGGISGLAAAVYTGHAGLKTVVFDGGKSQIHNISKINNYLGATNLSGTELLETFRKQAKDYAEIKDVKVESIQKEGNVFILQADGETYEAERVVFASNIEYDLLEKLGLEIAVNENIKNGKIKKVVGAEVNGKTSIPNLYVAGLLSGIPSQAIIAAGQGAAVGVHIAQEATGEKYMWHDK